MNFVWFLLVAIVSGVFAGMGMGGGTFLIPLLTLIMNVEQNVAQCINLLVFVPMAIITIVIYAKRKLIDFKSWWLVSIPACIVSTAGVLIAVNLSGVILKIIFGAFISIIGIIQIIIFIIKMVRVKSKSVKKESNK